MANVGNTAMGILMIPTFREGKLWISIPYFSISLSLNVTLTLMIVVRLVLHGRNVRAATGSRSGIGRLHKTIASILIESCALFTLGSLLVIGTYAANNPAVIGFVPLLGETQVRTFLRPRFLDGLFHVTMGWTGHCSAAHHSTSRRQECVDERHYRLRKNQFIQSSEQRGVDKWQRYPS